MCRPAELHGQEWRGKVPEPVESKLTHRGCAQEGGFGDECRSASSSPLVTGLDLAQEQVAVVDNCRDQGVAATLIAISCK